MAKPISAKITASLVHHLADRVDSARLDPMRADRQGHIDGLSLQAGFERHFLQDRAPRGESIRNDLLQRVDGGATLLARVRRHGAEPRKQRRNGAFFSKRRDSHGFKRGLVVRASRFAREFALAGFLRSGMSLWLRWEVFRLLARPSGDVEAFKILLAARGRRNPLQIGRRAFFYARPR